MNPKGQKVLPTAALVSLGLMTLASLNKKKDPGLPKTSELIGLMAVFTILSAGRDFDIPIVNGFAVMVMIVIALQRGPAAFGYLVDKISEKQSQEKLRRQGSRRNNRKSFKAQEI